MHSANESSQVTPNLQPHVHGNLIANNEALMDERYE
jgi:hypothetical protein